MSYTFWNIAVTFYALSQLIMHGKLEHWGYFFEHDSWELKYQLPRVKVIKNTLYRRMFDVQYLERFPGSSTLFTFVTDGYHLSQMLMKIFLVLTVVTYQQMFAWYYDAAIYLAGFGLVFTMRYWSLPKMFKNRDKV